MPAPTEKAETAALAVPTHQSPNLDTLRLLSQATAVRIRSKVSLMNVLTSEDVKVTLTLYHTIMCTIALYLKKLYTDLIKNTVLPKNVTIT